MKYWPAKTYVTHIHMHIVLKSLYVVAAIANLSRQLPNSKGLLSLFSLLPSVPHASQPTQYFTCKTNNITTLH